MCAIFGSKDKDKFLELAELNQYRGNFAHSTTVFQTGAFTLPGGIVYCL